MTRRFIVEPATLKIKGRNDIVVWIVIDTQRDFLGQVFRELRSAEKQAASLERWA